MTRIRLSEAMRLGSMLHPQCFDAIYQHVLSPDGRKEQVTATCALGAAYECIGIIDEWWEMPKEWRSLLSSPARCPVACRASRHYAYGVEELIAHLNDTHRWPRERIADFISELEKQLEMGQVREEIEAVLA